mmetsp:Transcript_22610/g.57661  ORF Transcript_22610/g.57661 Transcript_22610/m.57661 type:complete len:200 (-) Transcript_22610:56-655(-)
MAASLRSGVATASAVARPRPGTCQRWFRSATPCAQTSAGGTSASWPGTALAIAQSRGTCGSAQRGTARESRRSSAAREVVAAAVGPRRSRLLQLLRARPLPATTRAQAGGGHAPPRSAALAATPATRKVLAMRSAGHRALPASTTTRSHGTGRPGAARPSRRVRLRRPRRPRLRLRRRLRRHRCLRIQACAAASRPRCG